MQKGWAHWKALPRASDTPALDVPFCALMMLAIFGGMMFAAGPRAGKP